MVSGTEVEAVMDIATRLFAALGYDGTEFGQIAEAAGLDPGDLVRMVGGKRELYLMVMERAYREEYALMERLLAAFAETGSRAPMIDGYIDFYVTNRDIAALWIHRWLSDAADVLELEQRYIHPLIMMTADLHRRAAQDPKFRLIEDVDVQFTIWTMIWCVHGYATGGMLDEDGQPREPDDPEMLERLRRHLRKMLHRHLDVAGDSPG